MTSRRHAPSNSGRCGYGHGHRHSGSPCWKQDDIANSGSSGRDEHYRSPLVPDDHPLRISAQACQTICRFHKKQSGRICRCSSASRLRGRLLPWKYEPSPAKCASCPSFSSWRRFFRKEVFQRVSWDRKRTSLDSPQAERMPRVFQEVRFWSSYRIEPVRAFPAKVRSDFA